MQDHEFNFWNKAVEAVENDGPYILIDPLIARSNLLRLKAALPQAEVYYAIKSLNDPEVISALDTAVNGYDVASLGECNSLSSQGISAERMLFSNPTKIEKHIKESYRMGVRRFAFDSVDEAYKIAQHAPGSEVYLRIIVPDQGSSFALSKKFGADPIHAVPLLDLARELGLKPIGLAFHVGSQSENPYSWQAAIEECGQIIKRLAKVGIQVSFLNMGGGFPSNYFESAPTIEQIAGVINKTLKKHIPDSVAIAIEPGRFVSASAAVIVGTVSSRAQRSGQEWLYLDVGALNGLIEPLEMSEWKYPIRLVGDQRGEAKVNFTLTGPTCDSCDTFATDVLLPTSVKRGDKVMIGHAGAYTVVYASEFNGFEIPKRCYVQNNKEN